MTKQWVCKKAIIRTVYGGNYPRAVLRHPTEKLAWEYVEDGYLERIVDGKTPSDCTVWLGSFHRQGFGMYSVKTIIDGVSNSNSMNAQRLTMAISKGRPLLSHERVYAVCNNDECCNPSHLRIGDRSDCRIQSGTNIKYTNEWIEENLALLLYSTPTEIVATLGLTKTQAGNCKQLAKKWLNNAETLRKKVKSSS